MIAVFGLDNDYVERLTSTNVGEMGSYIWKYNTSSIAIMSRFRSDVQPAIKTTTYWQGLSFIQSYFCPIKSLIVNGVMYPSFNLARYRI